MKCVCIWKVIVIVWCKAEWNSKFRDQRREKPRQPNARLCRGTENRGVEDERGTSSACGAERGRKGKAASQCALSRSKLKMKV